MVLIDATYLRKLPKCEHHLHIEGCLEPELLFELARKNNVELPSKQDRAFESVDALKQRYSEFTSLDDFLHYYYIGMETLQTSDDFEALASAYFSRAHRDGVVHTELSFDIQVHDKRSIPHAVFIEGLQRACRKAEAEYGITSTLIMCFQRHLPVEHAVELYHSTRHLFRDGTLGGVGLDSSEVGNPNENWKEIYALAKADGVLRTVHAGEEGDWRAVESTLASLDPHRIDHGVAIQTNRDLLEHMVRIKIPVTLCPVSNLKLQVVKAIEEVPLKAYLDAGLPISINSDDPAYFRAYILDNFHEVHRAFSLTHAEWRSIGKTAIESSFCSAQRKQELSRLLQAWESEHA